MNILVTGGAGYIGSHTVCKALEAGHDVYVLDDFSNSYDKCINSIIKFYQNKRFVKLINNPTSKISTVVEGHKIDGIIHFAANKSVGESVRDPIKYYRNNINSLLDVLKYMKSYWIKNLIFSSSCTVYGDTKNSPVTEDHPVAEAKSPYGATKIMCERILQDFSNAYPIHNIISLRYFNPIGANIRIPIGELPRGKPENLMSSLTMYASGLIDSFGIYGGDYDTPDGTAVRDYLDVNDLAECHVRCLDFLKEQQGVRNYDTYNVGTGRGISVGEIINTFKKVNNIDIDIPVLPRRGGDVEIIYGDVSKIQKDLGFRCETTLEESLRNAWYWQKYLLGLHD